MLTGKGSRKRELKMVTMLRANSFVYKNKTHTHIQWLTHSHNVMYTLKCKYILMFTEQQKEMFWEKKITWIMWTNTRLPYVYVYVHTYVYVWVCVITKHTKHTKQENVCINIYCIFNSIANGNDGLTVHQIVWVIFALIRINYTQQDNGNQFKHILTHPYRPICSIVVNIPAVTLYCNCYYFS